MDGNQSHIISLLGLQLSSLLSLASATTQILLTMRYQLHYRITILLVVTLVVLPTTHFLQAMPIQYSVLILLKMPAARSSTD